MKGINVSMHITGKTLGESLKCMNMRKNNVLIGKLRTLFKHTQMDANMSTDVDILMGGKNKNIIL